MLFLSVMWGCQKEKPVTPQYLSLASIPVDVAKFVKTVDGDTLKVVYDNVTQNIRLIGIDTPESRFNAKAISDSKKLKQPVEKIVAQGIIASVYTKSLIKPNSMINIEFDKQKTDQYKRLLGYVFVNGKMLNATIISDGYAYPMTIKPNVKYSKEFIVMYNQAVKEKKGLWNKTTK